MFVRLSSFRFISTPAYKCICWLSACYEPMSAFFILVKISWTPVTLVLLSRNDLSVTVAPCLCPVTVFVTTGPSVTTLVTTGSCDPVITVVVFLLVMIGSWCVMVDVRWCVVVGPWWREVRVVVVTAPPRSVVVVTTTSSTEPMLCSLSVRVKPVFEKKRSYCNLSTTL